MNVIIQFPTNRDAELRYAADLVRRAPSSFRVAAMVNGPDAGALMKEHQGVKRLHLFSMDVPKGKPVSMMALRDTLLRRCHDEFSDGYSIITDGDVTYHDRAFQFIDETVTAISKPIKRNGFYCNMRGFFGSAGVGDRTLIPRGLPLGTNCGTIINRALAEKYVCGAAPPHLPGVCEDPMLTSWFFLVNGAIPLRRFKAPIHHKKSSSNNQSPSSIHSHELVKANNFPIVRDMWERAAAEVGLKPPKERWGGIPLNKKEVGRILEDGSVLLQYAPQSDAIVRRLLGSRHPLNEHLRPYRNWEAE